MTSRRFKGSKATSTRYRRAYRNRKPPESKACAICAAWFRMDSPLRGRSKDDRRMAMQILESVSS
jgi:hypothetical protein